MANTQSYENLLFLLPLILTIMKKIFFLSILLLLTSASTGSGQENRLGQMAGQIAANPHFKGASIGFLAITTAGDTLVNVNPERLMVPASNMKLLTTGAALHTLGEEYKYQTLLGHNGEIVDGVLKGDLYIIGQGDPLTGSKDSIATPLDLVFAQWKECLDRAGIKKIDGRVIGDDRYFEGPAEDGSWLWEDLGAYYGTGVSALSFYENVQDIHVTAGENVGDELSIRLGYPECPWMNYRYNCSTGEKGTGDKLYLYTTDLAPIGELRGTFAVDRAPKRVECSNKFPAYTCAKYFHNYLTENKIKVTGEAMDLGETFGIPACEHFPQDSLKILGSTDSNTLKRIAFATNYDSNNMFAETLFRTLGKEIRGNADYTESAEAMKASLRSLGLDVSKGIKIQDGSGLSRKNLVSADFFCRFLLAMTESEGYEAFLYSLPHPGSEGTMKIAMRKGKEAVAGNIYLKSGSMGGTYCYSGYVLPSGGGKEDTIIFSFMINNCTASAYRQRNALLDLIYLLAETI